MERAGYLIGLLTARCIGLVALFPILEWILMRFLPAFRAEGPIPDFIVLYGTVNVVAFWFISLIFTVPSLARRILRRRRTIPERLLAGTFLICSVMFILAAGLLALDRMGLGTLPDRGFVLAFFGLLGIFFLWHFILPGHYAAALADEYEEEQAAMNAL